MWADSLWSLFWKAVPKNPLAPKRRLIRWAAPKTQNTGRSWHGSGSTRFVSDDTGLGSEGRGQSLSFVTSLGWVSHDQVRWISMNFMSYFFLKRRNGAVKVVQYTHNSIVSPLSINPPFPHLLYHCVITDALIIPTVPSSIRPHQRPDGGLDQHQRSEPITMRTFKSGPEKSGSIAIVNRKTQLV